MQQEETLLGTFMHMLRDFDRITPNLQLRMQLLMASLSFLHHAMVIAEEEDLDVKSLEARLSYTLANGMCAEQQVRFSSLFSL